MGDSDLVLGGEAEIDWLVFDFFEVWRLLLLFPWFLVIGECVYGCVCVWLMVAVVVVVVVVYVG